MFCINCGCELREQAKFCQKCGTPVSDSGADASQPHTSVGAQSYGGGAYAYWQTAPSGPVVPQALSTIRTMELIDGIVWAVIAGLQICNALLIMWSLATLGNIFNILGLTGLLGSSWGSSLLLLLIGALNAYSTCQTFRLASSLKKNPPTATIAYYDTQFAALLSTLIYNLIVAPVGVLGAIYKFIIRWYVLEHKEEIANYISQVDKEKEAAGVQKPILYPGETMLVQDSAIENSITVYARSGILCLTDQRLFLLTYTNHFENRRDELAVFQSGIPQIQLQSAKKLLVQPVGGKKRKYQLSGEQHEQWARGLQQIFGATSQRQPYHGQQQARSFCPSCGTPIPAGTSFCPNCGARQN